jgi:small conductance mechanosensitive channel
MKAVLLLPVCESDLVSNIDLVFKEYKRMNKIRFTTLWIGALLISSASFFSLIAITPALAQDSSASPQQIALAAIEKQTKALETLKARIKKSKEGAQNAYVLRYDKGLKKMLELNLGFAEGVANHGQAEIKEKYRPQAIQVLTSQFELAPDAIKRFSKQITMPEKGMSAAEQAATYSRVYSLVASINEGYELWFKSIEVSRQFEIDVTAQESLLQDIFIERAANISVILDHAVDNISALRASVKVMPDDAELTAQLAVATNHIQVIADAFDFVLLMMDSMELETSDYHEQLLNSTGQITTDVFEVDVLSGLLLGWGDRVWDMVIEEGPNLLVNIFLLVIIFLAFRKLANLIQPLLERALENSQLELSKLLRRMVVSIVRNVIIILGGLIALSQIGISLGPLLAGLGMVGLVIGFALQDTLSNFAAGMMILIYRPFDVGDLVEAGSVSGTVHHMSLVNTTIMTLDNQTIIVPNNKVWGDVIRNVTAQTIRRVDMTFGISYTDDIPKTERILLEILASHEKVLDEPEAIVKLNELGDSSVNFVVRPWINSDDYLDVYWDVTRAVKMRFDEEGISIPFPQRDVHLYNEPST